MLPLIKYKQRQIKLALICLIITTFGFLLIIYYQMLALLSLFVLFDFIILNLLYTYYDALKLYQKILQTPDLKQKQQLLRSIYQEALIYQHHWLLKKEAKLIIQAYKQEQK